MSQESQSVASEAVPASSKEPADGEHVRSQQRNLRSFAIPFRSVVLGGDQLENTLLPREVLYPEN